MGTLQKVDSLLNKGKDAIGGIKNFVAGYTEIEIKVREATNNDAWGASSTVRETELHRLCEHTFTFARS